MNEMKTEQRLFLFFFNRDKILVNGQQEIHAPSARLLTRKTFKNYVFQIKTLKMKANLYPGRAFVSTSIDKSHKMYNNYVFKKTVRINEGR